MRYLLGIDNGGSEIKCAVFDTSGKEIAVVGERLPIEVPFPGYSERDLEQVWEANKRAMKKAIEKAGICSSEIIGIGLTGYGNGLCFIDAIGNPVEKAIVSTDNRAADLVLEFKKNGTERCIFEKTYQNIWSAQPAALLPWFLKNKPEVLKGSQYAIGIKDYIRYKLTGKIVTELTEASSGCLYNLKTREFDKEIFELLEIQDYFHLMPKCIGSTEIAGTITREVAVETGLKEGTPVVGGYFDIDASALASGILDGESLCLIAGTWSINEYLTEEACKDYDKVQNTVTLSYKEGYYIVEDSSPTSASNFDWYLKQFVEPIYPTATKEEVYTHCNECIAKKTPYDNDVIFVPYLFSSATNPDSKGAFFNLTSFHDREHVLQSVYEGVAFSTMYHVERLLRNGKHYKAARLSGGVAKSRVWSQIMSDVLQLPIEILECTEPSAMGAAMSAGIACGVFSDIEDAVEKMVRVKETLWPNREYAEIYRKKFSVFLKALDALDFFHTEKSH